MKYEKRRTRRRRRCSVIVRHKCVQIYIYREREKENIVRIEATQSRLSYLCIVQCFYNQHNYEIFNSVSEWCACLGLSWTLAEIEYKDKRYFSKKNLSIIKALNEITWKAAHVDSFGKQQFLSIQGTHTVTSSTHTCVFVKKKTSTRRMNVSHFSLSLRTLKLSGAGCQNIQQKENFFDIIFVWLKNFFTFT